MTSLATHLPSFLQKHLPNDRGVSPRTIKSYSDTFVLLLRYASERLSRRPTDLQVEDLRSKLILEFLESREAKGNSVSTRNLRLAAIKSFFRYIEFEAPDCLEIAASVRAIPSKKTSTRLVDYLDRDEIDALLRAPNPRSLMGSRDRAMLHVAYACGLRVSELISIELSDFSDRMLSTIHIVGKGRAERVLPLWKTTRTALQAWMDVRPAAPTNRLFLNAKREPLTRDGFAYILDKHIDEAAKNCHSLELKHVTPHVLRHSCAMHILASTGDIRKVALWLGHASIKSTEIYLRADPMEKLQILDAHSPAPLRRGRFKPVDDTLLQMLEDVRRASTPSSMLELTD